MPRGRVATPACIKRSLRPASQRPAPTNSAAASHIPVALTLFVPAASPSSLPLSSRLTHMASIAGSSALSFARPVKAINTNSVAFSTGRKGNAFLRLQPVPMRSVSCAAKKDTVDKVCEIVKKQLALPDHTEVCGESKFSELGADSLDTVEIVMGLEEHFDISVEESSAQTIATVEDAADLIDKLVAGKA